MTTFNIMVMIFITVAAIFTGFFLVVQAFSQNPRVIEMEKMAGKKTVRGMILIAGLLEIPLGFYMLYLLIWRF